MFRERLKSLRQQRGLTQKALSVDLFVSQQTVAKWELGTSSPNPEMLASIARYFGVSSEYLLGLSDEPTYITTTTFDDGLVLEAEGTTKEPPTLEERERLEAAIKGGLYSTGPILPDDELEKRIEAVLRRMLADEKDNGNKDL